MSSVIITRLPDLTSFEFDLVEDESYDESVKVTEHPVETGSSPSDHAAEEPIKLSLKVMVTETPMLRYQTVGAVGSLRVFLATKFLQECKKKALNVTTTQDGTFTNMFIESFSYSKNIAKNRIFDIKLKQVRFGIAQTVQIPPTAPAKAAKTGASTAQSAGQQATSAAGASQAAKDQSSLYSILSSIGVL